MSSSMLRWILVAAMTNLLATNAAASDGPVANGTTVNASDGFERYFLRPKGGGDSLVSVSLLGTLEKIAKHTGLRLRGDGLADETLQIVPGNDPFDVLRQLSRQTRYRVTIDRISGVLVLSDEGRSNGITILREVLPVQQIGKPVATSKLPLTPVLLTEALKVLSPADFALNYSDSIDLNIRVDISKAASWTDALLSAALQTPYRLIFDWDKRIVSVRPAAQNIKGN